MRAGQLSIVIVDDASPSPGHRQFLESIAGGPIELVLKETNGGFSKTVNEGLRRVKSQDVIVLNSDTIAREGWLESLQMMAYESEDIGIAAPRLLYPNGSIQSAGSDFDRTSTDLFRHRFRNFRGNIFAASRPVDLVAATGACLYVKAQLLQDIGGFDEKFFMGHEDMDYCLRARQKGWRIRYCPHSTLLHVEGGTRGTKPSEGSLSSFRWFLDKWEKTLLEEETSLTIVAPESFASVPTALRSLIFGAMMRSYPRFRRFGQASLWWRAWAWCLRTFRGPVLFPIHGRRAVFNFGYTYPLNTRLYAHLNNPLIELVHQVRQVRNRALTVVDVGAAIGDTVLFIHANCPGEVARYFCIDGDAEFLSYLAHNLASIPGSSFRRAHLSSSNNLIPSLVRTHEGTASAQGSNLVKSVTLDDVVEREGLEYLDVLKIDVDGLDGVVLEGARKTLQRFRPAVIFEWHPILCVQTKNSYLGHFRALEEVGFTTFLWFTKFGDFSHFTVGVCEGEIDLLARFSMEDKSRSDWHYDVIALHRDDEVSPRALAECGFARSARSRS